MRIRGERLRVDEERVDETPERSCALTARGGVPVPVVMRVPVLAHAPRGASAEGARTGQKTTAALRCPASRTRRAGAALLTDGLDRVARRPSSESRSRPRSAAAAAGVGSSGDEAQDPLFRAYGPATTRDSRRSNTNREMRSAAAEPSSKRTSTSGAAPWPPGAGRQRELDGAEARDAIARGACEAHLVDEPSTSPNPPIVHESTCARSMTEREHVPRRREDPRRELGGRREAAAHACRSRRAERAPRPRAGSRSRSAARASGEDEGRHRRGMRTATKRGTRPRASRGRARRRERARARRHERVAIGDGRQRTGAARTRDRDGRRCAASAIASDNEARADDGDPPEERRERARSDDAVRERTESPTASATSGRARALRIAAAARNGLCFARSAQRARRRAAANPLATRTREVRRDERGASRARAGGAGRSSGETTRGNAFGSTRADHVTASPRGTCARTSSSSSLSGSRRSVASVVATRPRRKPRLGRRGRDARRRRARRRDLRAKAARSRRAATSRRRARASSSRRDRAGTSRRRRTRRDRALAARRIMMRSVPGVFGSGSTRAEDLAALLGREHRLGESSPRGSTPARIERLEVAGDDPVAEVVLHHRDAVGPDGHANVIGGLVDLLPSLRGRADETRAQRRTSSAT